MILVTGATGTVGRALVDQLMAVGTPVRATTRHPGAAALPDGVEVVAADLGDPDSLAAAFAGVDRVFLLSAGSDGPQHDKNLTEAAVRAGITHIVKLSALTAGDDTATDPISRWHRAGEETLRRSGVAWTFLRPTGFMSNALMWAPTIHSHGTVYAPFGAGRTAVIDPCDVAAVAATVLTEPGHENRAYPLTGPEALSPAEQVDVLADVLARPLRYVDVPPSAARQAMSKAGMPPVIADAVIALLATGLDAAAAIVHPDVEKLTGTPPRTFRQWAQEAYQS